MPDVKAGDEVVPGISCPFPESVSPHATEVQNEHMRWADRHGVFLSGAQRKLFAAMNIGDLAGRMYPEGSLEDLVLLTDWCAWLFLRDDRWDTTDDLIEWERLAERDRAYLRLMRRFSRPIPGDEEDGLAGALSDLCDRLRRRARENGLGDPVDGGFVALIKEFFFSHVKLAFYQRHGEIPSLSDYVKIRPVTGGLDILTHILAATDGVRIPAGLLAEPTIARLTEASHNVCCWRNDIVSLNKELLTGEVNNLILVLLHDPETGCDTMPEAVEEAVRMIYAEQDAFVELRWEIKAAGGRHTHVAAWYARILSDRISGVFSWHESCVRYWEVVPVNP